MGSGEGWFNWKILLMVTEETFKLQVNYGVDGELLKKSAGKKHMITISDATQETLKVQVISIMLDCHLSALSTYTAKLVYKDITCE